MTTIVTIVGNPKIDSRTSALAHAVSARLREVAGAGESSTIELAHHTGELFDWSSPGIAALVERVLAADLLVVASPTYKATYTGLLKLFLERFKAGALAGKPTVPVMTGGGPAHALAVEHALRPLLVEIGASVPTRGLFVTEASLVDPAVAVDAWFETVPDSVLRLLTGAHTVGGRVLG